VSDDRGTTEGRLTRVVVQGTSGSGKTTLSNALADALGISCLELDGLYQQPNWNRLEVKEFRARVGSFVEQTRWVVVGNYSRVRDILWPRSTTILFIDLPKRVVMTRVIQRTILRIVKREQLWNGNRESLRNALSRTRCATSSCGPGIHTRNITMSFRTRPASTSDPTESSSSPAHVT